jgi:hypothetical protein
VTWLQRSVGLQRVMCFAALSPNLGSAFGIHQVESEMTVSSPRLRELYFAATGSKSPLFVTDGVRLPSPAFFARAAVRFLVISDWAPRALEEARQRGYREAFHDGRNSIFEVSGLPRYFFTSSYRIVTAEAAKRSALGSRALRTLLLEEQPSFTPLPNREPEAEVEVRDYRLNRYRLAVTTDRAGLVSMAESRMPGWTATVNGRDVPILAANYAFRAVEVPAGTSVIEMRYRPPGLRAGALASALGLIGIGAVLLVRPRRS